ncbi:MAG: 50S ribosomal protein L23 [Simkaniaceae bacterium]|nr:50S ribosomal protein L23 [Simkaniaceae bacterium]
MNPYSVIKSRYVTEKTAMLENLQNMTSNRCLAKCKSPKYVFIVDVDANKIEIKKAIETIYAERKIKVTAVNVINTKPKQRRVRGRVGFRSAFKKAIVTLEVGDSLGEAV